MRVGAASPTANVSVTNVATVAPQAALNASISPTSGPISASGGFNLLNPGATNSSSLTVGLATATAGNFTGANAGVATINFVSDASNVGNCAPNCQMNLASQTVNVAGKVYTQAVGAVAPGSIDFGIVRVGDTVSARNITIDNTAATTALNDTLRANISGLSGALSTVASVGGIAAQSSGTAAVSLNTANAGVFSQAAALSLLSQNADMADVSAGADAQVFVSAQVNNLARAVFGFSSGAGLFSGSGNSYALDLGNIVLGSGTLSSSLFLHNDVAGPADSLKGQFDLSGVDDLVASGWIDPTDLQAGNMQSGLGLQFGATALGAFSDTITFSGISWNRDSADFGLGLITISIFGNVITGGGGNVPEPGTLALLMAAAAAGWATRRRARALKRAA